MTTMPKPKYPRSIEEDLMWASGKCIERELSASLFINRLCHLFIQTIGWDTFYKFLDGFGEGWDLSKDQLNALNIFMSDDFNGEGLVKWGEGFSGKGKTPF